VRHQFAKKLRRDQTDVEGKLWLALRDRGFHGFKFRRQQPVGPYIVDFICFDARLVIELDGGQHGTMAGEAADAKRSTRLGEDGYRVRRFWNRDLIENFDGVLEQIWRDLGSPETPMIVAVGNRPVRA
jgi:very-short-patch-repair endonuclease